MFLCHARLGSADPEGAHENANARPEGREVSVPTSENAAACGRSKDWVRRCEMRALRKLRKPHHLMALRPFNQQRQGLTSRPD